MLTKTVGNAVISPATILASKHVRDGIIGAWDKTQAESCEYGGWIYFSEASGEYRTKEKKGQATGIILTPVPDHKDAGYVIVADWHCHPDNGVPGARPSDQDIANAKSKDYLMLVVTVKKAPKSGWKQDLLAQTQIVDDTHAKYRVWNIL